MPLCFFFHYFISFGRIDCLSCFSLPDLIQVDHAFVGRVLARGQPLYERHVLSFPVAQLGVTTWFYQITGLSDHKLTEFVDKCLLLPGEYAYVCCYHHALLVNELLKIHLLLEFWLCFHNQHAVICCFLTQTAAEPSENELLRSYFFGTLEVLSDVFMKSIHGLLLLWNF